MKLAKILVLFLLVAFSSGVMPGAIHADELRIAVLQGDKDYSKTYQPLTEHLEKMGIPVKMVEAPTYEAAVKMFAAGQVEAIFSGSGIPGSMFVIHRLRMKNTFAGFKPKPSALQQARLSN